MSFDPRKETVTARIILDGVMLMCINRNTWCELGVIKCPKHPAIIEVKTNVGNNSSKPVEVPWPKGHDLLFNVKESKDPGVSPHPKAAGEYSFSKILDLEGNKCHKQRMPVLTHSLDGRRLGVTAGRLYTHSLTLDDLELMEWIEPSDPGTIVKPPLGKIAKEVGINIRCREVSGAGIDILDTVTGEVLAKLPVAPNTWYEINVNNDCREEEVAEWKRGKTKKAKVTPVGTDFRYFYNIVISPSAKKFDLHKIPKPVTAPFPGVCETILLSKTETLGLT